jgi:cytochrome c oxidase subunit II
MKEIVTRGTGKNRIPSCIRQVFLVAIAAGLSLGGSSGMLHAFADPSVPVIVIHAKRYAFAPSQITLQAGRTVRLVFVSDDVPHSIAIPGLHIELPIVRNPKSQVVITPTETGDFAGECARYCGVGHDKMTFVVHVLKQSQ